MPPGTAPQRTPLRRISQGSLFRLSRSGAYPDAPHGLGFLEPALSELADEIEALNTSVQCLRSLGDALGTFNESFASWLYVMNMNALTVDWPQVRSFFSGLDSSDTDAVGNAGPDGRILQTGCTKSRTQEEDAAAALAALQAAQAPPHREPSPEPPSTDKTTLNADASAAGNETTMATTASAGSKIAVKKKGKPKMTAKEKRERSLFVDKVVTALPLEFRGSDPNLRRNVETVIEGFLDRPERGLGKLVKPPDLTQARANKCLIALVNRKIVQKDNSTGAVQYHWHGLPA
ncbi:hypothetical protein POSPLADRAFT_1047535 [Postia placenta MAD-698-R-SB12]|uniref:DASH complex subunit DAM1 n=1 Tax=Postia placenta MAD-698-R-SB12 TaxID=670580 RepID=A0A1X6MYP8_9APHY|nr:hypothetical protein POSPLADRAFT_1047535 [Postia placenta MAD-698-R-SB12]OSX61313.1 hypothetical protein POSPLADRAFT_1047535 [Postia placenta MAD-698-R-SB12]